MSPLMYIIGGAYAIGILFVLACAVYVKVTRPSHEASK